MAAPFMDAYVRLLIKTCHKRGVHAMGGMAAQVSVHARARVGPAGGRPGGKGGGRLVGQMLWASSLRRAGPSSYSYLFAKPTTLTT